MKNAYILHGCCDRQEYRSEQYPSPSNAHWIPWLQKQLLMKGYGCQTPEMPTPYKPTYDEWKNVFDVFPVDEETSLIGHSCGGGFLLKWLQESRKVKIDKLILVAPWRDPEGYFGNFLRGNLKPDLGERLKELHIFYSEDEPVGGVKESVEGIKAAYPFTIFHQFLKSGHFCLEEMGTDQFPELLAIVLG